MGGKYFGFIFSAYAITFLVLAGLAVWALAVHASRKKALAKLEEKGIKRRSGDLKK